MAEKYKSLKVKELQDLLQKRSLPHSGKKEELIDRLVRDDQKKELERLEREFELDADIDESKVTDITLTKDLLLPIEKEAVLSDVEDDFMPLEDKKNEETKVQQPETEESKDKEDKKSFQYTPVTFASKEEQKELTAADKLKLEAERRLQRSKRFGVKLGEQEMREIRAARFGTAADIAAAAPAKENKENDKKLTKEELILKKRAERFGLPFVETKNASEEEKQKKKKTDTTNNLKKVNKGRVTKQNNSKVDPKLKKNVNNKQQKVLPQQKKQQPQKQQPQKQQPQKQQPQKQQPQKQQPQKQKQKAQPQKQQQKPQTKKQQQRVQPQRTQPQKQQQRAQPQKQNMQPKQQITQPQKKKVHFQHQGKQQNKPVAPIGNRTVTIQQPKGPAAKKHGQMKTQANSLNIGNGRQVIIDNNNSRKRKNTNEPVETAKKRRWRP